VRFFEIQAEFLHLYVGRRAATPTDWPGLAWVPFTIGAVRLHPESGLVIVTPVTPTPASLDFGFDPDVVVRVEHTSWTLDPRPLDTWSTIKPKRLETVDHELDWSLS
jgi:hypothetical protein